MNTELTQGRKDAKKFRYKIYYGTMYTWAMNGIELDRSMENLLSLGVLPEHITVEVEREDQADGALRRARPTFTKRATAVGKLLIQSGTGRVIAEQGDNATSEDMERLERGYNLQVSPNAPNLTGLLAAFV